MLLSGFTPTMFISVGETAAFFTLRERYLHEVWIGGRAGYMSRSVRAAHIQNLSQDPEEALAKAQAISAAAGMELEDASPELLEQLMRDIQRADSAEKLRRQGETLELEALWAAERVAAEQRKRDMVSKGLIPFGKHEGKAFADAPRGYLNWLMSSVSEFDEGSLYKLLAEAVLAACSHLRFPIPHPTLMLGEVKARLVLDVTVVKVRGFDRRVFGSWSGQMERVWFTTMVDKSSGACLLLKAPKFVGEEGDEVRIKATVKEHSDYNGQAQTVVQRMSLL